MAFGYVPIKSDSFARRIVKRFLGWPYITRRLQAPIVMRYLAPELNDVILDIGSSNGHYTVEIAQRAKMAVAIEYDQRWFGQLSDARGFGGSLTACTADALKLPFADKTVDKILLSGTLQSLDASAAAKECMRLLKPGGCLVAVVLADHTLIRDLYKHARNDQPGVMLQLAGVPPTYAEFKEEYCHRRLMTRYYTDEDLKQLFSSMGFRLEAGQYVPSGSAAMLLDIHHLLTWRSGVSWIGFPLFFLAFYPFFWLAQSMADNHQIGGEWVGKFFRLEENL